MFLVKEFSVSRIGKILFFRDDFQLERVEGEHLHVGLAIVAGNEIAHNHLIVNNQFAVALKAERFLHKRLECVNLLIIILILAK